MPKLLKNNGFCRKRCRRRSVNNSEFVMRNSELMTGFARTRIYSQIVGDDAHIVPITATCTVARNPIINNAEFTVKSRAGACSRRKNDPLNPLSSRETPKSRGKNSILWQRRWILRSKRRRVEKKQSFLRRYCFCLTNTKSKLLISGTINKQ